MKAKIQYVCTKEELRAALDQSIADRTTLMAFLVGAEQAGQTVNGRSATDALKAAARLLRYSDRALAELRRLGP